MGRGGEGGESNSKLGHSTLYQSVLGKGLNRHKPFCDGHTSYKGVGDNLLTVHEYYQFMNIINFKVVMHIYRPGLILLSQFLHVSCHALVEIPIGW